VAYLVHHLLSAAAAARPDSLAVVDGDRSLTYSELEERSNRLAHLLVGEGVRPGDRVGIYLEKSMEGVVGIYAALKAGAAYVPLDPHSPPARLGYIAGNCGIRCLLSGVERAAEWAHLRAAGGPVATVVTLNAPEAPAEHVPPGVRTLGTGAAAGQPTTPPPVRTIDLDLAYILYTSGSTGEPKGVKLSHLNALRFVEWAAREFVRGPEDRLSSHAPFHFDLSVFDLYAAAATGAAVVLVPAGASAFPIEIRRFIERQRITVWYSVPSVLTMLVLRGGLKGRELPGLHTVLFAGEVFPTRYLRQLMAVLPHARFANLYGPTETNVCTWYEVPPIPDDETRAIPIGRAIDNVEVFAWTDDGRVARPGEVGELYVRGGTVMQGYWGDPERTARGLVRDPRDPERADLAYRTGDLVQEETDGNYRFLGRRDAQVKSRGYRIELGEIEAALYAHPAVAECGVVAVPDELVTNRLKAFVVVRDQTGVSELARFCADRLPEYMVPDLWELAEQLPKTSTGKLNRQALLEQAAARS
jgi:amino acid adenylation domain-containing protein